jgi:subtilisin-like proprotein convertase family protein
MGILALALSVTVGITVSAEAKKQKKAKTTFNGSKVVNGAIPEDVAVGASIPLRSQITIGKSFKGKVVGDVNVTVQTTGSAAGAAQDLNGKLTAPNGRTIILFEFVGDQSIGPWTMDDDTPVQICDQTTPPACEDPDSTLNRPFAGTSNLNDDDDDVRPLSSFDGVGMKGVWTLTVFDDDPTLTSTLNQWGLKVTAAKPVK